MNRFRHELAPISSAAWDMLTEEAGRVFAERLSARRVVDVEGPHGAGTAALNMGRVQEEPGPEGLQVGVRTVRPLFEVRSPFDLSLAEISNADRGALDVMLDPLRKAAARLADFEDETVLYGRDRIDLDGMKQASAHKALDKGDDADTLLQAVVDGIAQLELASIGGPYGLILEPKSWRLLTGSVKGYPLRGYLKELLEGPILIGYQAKDNFLVSMRGGDIRLVLGEDLSLGYEDRSADVVHLYFLESYTVQVITPESIVVIT